MRDIEQCLTKSKVLLTCTGWCLPCMYTRRHGHVYVVRGNIQKGKGTVWIARARQAVHTHVMDQARMVSNCYGACQPGP